MRKTSTYSRVADIIDFDELLADLDREAANASTQARVFEDEVTDGEFDFLLRVA